MTKPAMKPFFLLWSGQALSLLGSQVAQFALIWWLTLETGSATVLTTATLVGLLPQIVLGPLVGALIDRWSRHRILLVADAAIAAVSLALAALFWSGGATSALVLAALLLRAVGSGFHQPTMTASTSLMVPEEHLARIQGLNKTLEGGLFIFAAPLAALLLGAMPVAAILMLDVVTAAFAIAPLFAIRVPQPEAHGGAAEGSSVAREVVAGLRYLWRWPGLSLLVAMGAVVNLFMAPASALLPLLVREHFGGGALRFGWIVSAFGVGTIAGGVVLGAWGGFRRRVVTSMCGLLGVAAAILTVGLAPSSMYGLALGGMFAAGSMVVMVNGPLQALMQAAVAPQYQGRVFALVQTVSLAAAPLGLTIAGPLADLVGVRSWFLAGAAACGLMGLCGFAIPVVLQVEDRAGQRRDTMPTNAIEPVGGT